MKKLPTSQLKKKLDKIFSQYVRHKYAKRGYVSCYTCDKVYMISEMQNGHFVSRANLATRYDERNCRPQCIGCNIFGRGRISIFAERLEREKKGIVATLYRESNKIVKDFPYPALIDEYQEKLKSLGSP